MPSDTGGSPAGLPQELEASSAASSWEVVTPSDKGVHRNLERTVAAAYQTLEVGPVKHVWEDDFWGSLFAASPPDASKNFYGASLKRPLQPELPETQVVPAAVKPRPAERADLRFYEMSVVRRTAVTWKQVREDQLAEAVGSWAVFISRWSAGVQVRDQICSLDSGEARQSMVADVLGNKAPSTLRKRLRYALGVEELDLSVKSRRSSAVMHLYEGSMVGSHARRRPSQVYDYDNSQNLAYVECPVAYHKNMRSRVMRHDLLPMIAPGLGVVGPNWARLWKLARQELGLVDPPDFPVMPAPDKSGAPTVRPLDTEEMGRWLRCILTGSSAKQGEKKISSHSCKCTMLSYAAKRGISITDRQLLGYHTTPHRMALTYSRDSAAHPLMILGKLIGEIREKKFLPDETRSGRLVGDADDVSFGYKAPIVVIKDEEVEEPPPREAELRASLPEPQDTQHDEEVDEHVTTGSSSSDSAPEVAEGRQVESVEGLMSTVIDSDAAFKQRCVESAGDQALHAKLCEQGIKNFKTLAFAIGSPQQPPTEAQFDAFSVRVYGTDPTMGQTAVLRHLHSEATTLVVQTYRDMVTHDPSDFSHTRKVPVPEKRARLDMQRRRLSGMEISGELEPSHQLLDLINQQYESGIITWVPASKCSKREAGNTLIENEM
ncbi:unnamed protein product [Symbiodinium necroappetens]|uniref:Uncharacterized protein n=1 Tax=Symbiodinium necroappetens TaxID=1628268 RepID=A0A812ZHZ9_9DINO|nr:unnamed protein product [Symbiodinium necroappetens]